MLGSVRCSGELSQLGNKSTAAFSMYQMKVGSYRCRAQQCRLIQNYSPTTNKKCKSWMECTLASCGIHPQEPEVWNGYN